MPDWKNLHVGRGKFGFRGFGLFRHFEFVTGWCFQRGLRREAGAKRTPLLIACSQQFLRICASQFCECSSNVTFYIVDRVVDVAMCAAHWFLDDGVNQAKFLQVLTGELQGIGRAWCLGSVTPENGSAAFR